MPFNYENDLIDVPGTGLRLCTLENKKTEDFEWKEGNIRLFDLGTRKTYEIYISENHKDYSLIIRPRKKYECSLFEQVFEFCRKCTNYTEDRIVGLR